MNKNNKTLLWLPVIAAAFLIAGLWLGSFLSRNPLREGARQKLDMVLDIIAEQYVDPIAYDSLIELTLPELLKNLDPHSVYIPASSRTATDRDLEGSFYGIGIQFQMMNDTLYVLEVISSGAAEEAGIIPGDRIIEVDGTNIAGVNIDQEKIFGMLRGPKDTHVQVTVKRHSSPEPLKFDLVRAEVPVSPIDASYIISDSIGYIRLGKFSENTYPEFLNTLGQLRYDGAKSYIIDLRGNVGGYMNPAVLAANEFLPEGRIIVMTKGRDEDDKIILPSSGMGSFTEEDVVVLMDEFSASSSEILAGALQDNDRALIIGRRSFGKGLVQRQFDLPDSSEFRLTVQRYYTPSGRCIQKSYTPGNNNEYELEILNRYDRGEIFSADSLQVDSALIFHTVNGRPVYGGGGIIPDVFVPSDTSGVTSYYIKVANAGLLRKFAYEYADLNRESLNESRDTNELLSKLPSDNVLLQSFVNYASSKGGIAPRWYYINISQQLIVNQLKALIARDIVGIDGYFEIVNASDPVVLEAVKRLKNGDAASPVKDTKLID
ncbi:MAG: S41 family peptidase [Muribaculaceae bacterium]|nr:S41 family peptidase [Muribaculaceae bacterium]